MIEPNPKTFGLKRNIDSNEYELINKSTPNPSDYGVTNEYCKKIENKETGMRFYTISFLLLLPFISKSSDIGFISTASYYLDSVIQSFNKSILSGLGSITLSLFLLVFMGMVPFSITLFISIPTAMLMEYIYKEYFINFSEKHKKYIAYNNSVNEYIQELETAKRMYESAMNRYNNELKNERKKKIDFWKSLDGRSFEKELASLFQAQGYTAKLTPVTNDHGIDIILKKDNKKIIVQCKQHSKPVGPHVVRDLFGTMVSSKSDEAILACTSGFTSGVYEYVKDKNIKLMDINDILIMKTDFCESGRS